MIDRYGKCPNKECNCNWDAGNILDNLRKLHVLSDKSEEELANIAHTSFGYNSQNRKHFSKVIAITTIGDESVPTSGILEPDFYMCPECRLVWDADTGKQFPSLISAKTSKLFTDEPDNTEIDRDTKGETFSGVWNE